MAKCCGLGMEKEVTPTPPDAKRYFRRPQLFFPVLPHPVFPAFPGRHVTASECQGSDVRVRNGSLRRPIFRHKAHEAFVECPSSTAIKNVAFDLVAVFAGNENIAAVVERLFKSGFEFVRLASSGTQPSSF